MRNLCLAVALLLMIPHLVLADIDLPVDNGVVTSGIGWRIDPFGSGKMTYHRGIDIAVPVGTPVHSVRKGRVVYSGIHGGHGSTVIVEHDNGDRSLYGHNAILRVNLGDVVEPGTIVAYSGNSGRSTGPHVHFEQIASGRPVIEEGLKKEEATGAQLAAGKNQRYLLEQKMEDSVNSILRTLNRSALSGQGG